ncbi:MAG: Asp-tRNA(Asn)/Glu-tRNA(Gln) amidotransferase subunit GatB, partial [Candidatus Nanoarchaeia archaeon]
MNFTEQMIIGLEVHIELNTQSKLFCSCATTGTDTPNTRVCQTCLGHPGSKPVVNKAAIEKGIKLALATKCELAPRLIFSRKSYFYPDMSKNYQITQYEEPLGSNGILQIDAEKLVGIERVHLEEDPAAMQHLTGYSLVDYNRSGNPLIELVTKPELYSPEEARAFMKKLRTVLLYLDIFDPERCIIKADANISIKQSGYSRVEIKNVTGFKEIERALFYEVERQQLIAQEGREILQETRGWDAAKGLTYGMRLKETEADYGYIIDPDLVPIDLDDRWIDSLRKDVPELADEKTERFTKLGVDPMDAQVLAQNKDIAELFDEVSKHIKAHEAAKWIRREVMRVLNFAKKSLADSKINAQQLIDLLHMIEHKQITEKTGQKLMEEIVDTELN